MLGALTSIRIWPRSSRDYPKPDTTGAQPRRGVLIGYARV